MFGSLRSKITVLLIVILLLVAAFIIFFTKRDVERAMFTSEQRSARNVLQLVELNINGRYKSLQNDKFTTITTRKEQLVRLNQVVTAGVEKFRKSVEQGLIPEEDAKRQTLEWLSGLATNKGEYFFVYDENYKALAYPEDDMIGEDLTAFKDMKNKVVVESMRDSARKYGKSFSTYKWKKLNGDEIVKKFGLFFYYRPWDWVIASALDIEDIERDVEEKRQEIINVLQESIPKIKIAESGFVLIFTGDGEVLVGPDSEIMNFRTLENKTTGNVLLEDMMKAAESELQEPMIYSVQTGPEKVQHLEAFAAYFKALDWYIVSNAYIDEIRRPAQQLLTRQGSVFAGVLVLSLLIGMLFVSKISHPLKRLTDYANVLPQQDFTSDEKHETPIEDLPKKYKDEVGKLAEAFIFMDEALRENIKSLMDATAARERIESELNVARDIQMGLLPKIFPPFPERTEMDLYAVLEPAKAVGGDLYDFFFIDEHHLCFILGDVSDKGVPAALFMAITKTMVKTAADRGFTPAEMMRQVNDDLSKDNPNSMFVTLLIAIIDLRTGRVEYANGGHNAPVHMDPKGDVTYIEEISGPLVGGMEGAEYNPLSLEMKPGDSLLFYTDGVTESMNEQKELYSDPRLLEEVQKLKDKDPKTVVSAIMHSVKEHAGDADQSDDITVLCLRYNGAA